MDKGQNERNWFSVLIFEAMGTCLLVYFAITGDHNPLVTSLALFTCYLLFAVISKGHFNPAVSLGEWLGNLNKDWENKNLGKEVLDFMLRIIAQGIGGLAGAYLAYLVLARHRMDGSFSVAPAFITKLCPKDPFEPSQCDATGTQQMQVYIVQGFCGFLFCLAYLYIPDPRRVGTSDNIAQAIAIALVFFGLAHVGHMAGASFNPVLSGSTIFF